MDHETFLKDKKVMEQFAESIPFSILLKYSKEAGIELKTTPNSIVRILRKVEEEEENNKVYSKEFSKWYDSIPDEFFIKEG